MLIEKVEKNRVGGNECKSIKKSGNKIVKILAKLKSWNLPKFKSRNLFKSKKIWIASTM